MIRRTIDADEIDELINHPLIRPTIGGDGALCADKLVEDRRNIFLVDEGGGALFAWRGPGIYEGHSFFLVRGREAISLGRAMLAIMQDQADMVWGLTPESLRHVRLFNRKIGFKSSGLLETPEGRCELFVKRY
jgi:hypothetical protein